MTKQGCFVGGIDKVLLSTSDFDAGGLKSVLDCLLLLFFHLHNLQEVLCPGPM